MPPSSSPITRDKVRHDFRARPVTVAAVSRITTNMIRVTFHGPDLLDFASFGPHDHLKLVVPDDTGTAPEPRIIDGRLERPFDGILRDYTPRFYSTAIRPPELMIDFFDHDDPGPATAWARRARPGQTTWILGPRGSALVPNGAEELLLFADETALPSIARWIEMSPGLHIIAHVIARGGDRAYLDYLPGAADPSLAANPEAPGAPAIVWHEDPASLLAATRAITAVAPTTFVWAGGEAGLLAELRRHLRTTTERPQLSIVGYWRAGEANYDHHAPLPD